MRKDILLCLKSAQTFVRFENYRIFVDLMTVFVQEDLCEDDVMIIDNGFTVFVWFGKNSSEMEKKLALKSAQVIITKCTNRPNFDALLHYFLHDNEHSDFFRFM